MPLPLFKDNGDRIAHTYNGLTLNDPTDDPDDTFELNVCQPIVQLDSVSDPHQNRDGIEVQDVRKVALVYRVDGVVRATTYAKLYDKIELLTKTFDPAKLAHENPDTLGFLAYDFSVPTEDTTNYATGLKSCRYYFRPRDLPRPADSQFQGIAALFTLELMARDPRRYLQTTSSVTAAGNVANTKASYRSWGTLTIEMSGAGSSTAKWTITDPFSNDHVFEIDLSGCSADDEVVVDMENQSVKVNGTEDSSLFVSGNEWLEVEPGTSTIAVANQANVSSWSLAWRPAFSE